MDDETKQYTLYKMFTYDGTPLRYGITSRPFDERMAEYRHHLDHGLWVNLDLDEARTVLVGLGRMTERDARVIERQAIERDRPLANDEFNPSGYRDYLADVRRRALTPDSVRSPVTVQMPGDQAMTWLADNALLLVLVLVAVGAVAVAVGNTW